MQTNKPRKKIFFTYDSILSMENQKNPDVNTPEADHTTRPAISIIHRFWCVIYGIALGTMVILTTALFIIGQPLIQRILLSSAPVPGIEVYERLAETQQLLSYFRNGNTSLLRGYTLDEAAHLTEVATLLRSVRWLRMAAIVVVIVSGWKIFQRHGGQRLQHLSGKALGVTAIGLISSLVVSIVGFSFLFVWFHKIFFVAAPWAFDPEVSKLVNLYPPEYFRMTLAAILSGAALTTFLIFVILRKKNTPDS